MPKPVFVPLAAGLQTELSQQLVQPGATLAMENCACEKIGQTRARMGFDLLSTASQATIPAGGTLPVPWQVGTLEGQLVRFNRAPIPIHTWARPVSAYVAPGTDSGLVSFRRGPIKLDVTPVFAGPNSVTGDGDVAVSSNVIVQATTITTDLGTRMVVVIMDRLTRKPIITHFGGLGTSTARVVINGNTNAVVAYLSGTALKADRYDLTTGALVQTVQFGTAVLAGTALDMRVGTPVVGANNVGILFRITATGNLTCWVVDSTNLAVNSSFTPRTTAAAVVSPDLGFGWLQDIGASGKFSIMICDAANGLRTLWDLPAPAAGFSNATATHVLDAGATANVRNLIGTTLDATATGKYRVMYEVVGAPVQIKAAIWNGAATSATQFRSVGIQSKFWLHAGNIYFLAAFSEDPEQAAYFVLACAMDTSLPGGTNSAPLAVALPRDGGGLTNNANAPSSAAVDVDGSIFVGVTEQVRTDEITAAGVATGTKLVLLAADLVRIRHPASIETELGRPAGYLSSLFVPGGLLGFFDGFTYGAAGFAYAPPIGTAVSQAGGSLDASASYTYRWVYRFQDKTGRVWRSGPSAPLTVSTTGANFKFQLTIPTLRLVDRGAPDTNLGYQIETYRTQGNAPGTHLLVAVVSNDSSADTVTFVDNVADANLGEELYTDGGGVENQLLPSISCAVEYQGRLVCAQAGTGTLWYSLEADFDHGPIFNEALTKDVGDPADPITGLAVFGEQLLVFKSGKHYILAGEGANALGQGNYSDRLADPAIGTTNPQSIAVADDGVWFRSQMARAGIHRTSGGTAEYVGGGVHAFDGFTITSAVVVKDKTEIRFYTFEGTTLVWNWTAKVWGTHVVQSCLTATIGYSGTPGAVYVRGSDGAVLSEATAASAPAHMEGGALGARYTARVQSPWYQGAGLAGWERIRRIQGVGEGGEKHTARVRLYKDLAISPFQTGALSFLGTEKRWTWEMRPSNQKSSAMMIEVEIDRPAPVSITPDAADSYGGAGAWAITNGNFDSSFVGGTIVITGSAGGNYDGTFTITAVTSSSSVVMSPLPAGGPGAITAATLTYQGPLTAGPALVGVSLQPIAKEGLDKLPATRRPT